LGFIEIKSRLRSAFFVGKFLVFKIHASQGKTVVNVPAPRQGWKNPAGNKKLWRKKKKLVSR